MSQTAEMPAATAPDRAEMIRRAQSLIPALKARAEAADNNRRVPDETIRELLDLQLLQMLAPRRYNGLEMDFPTFVDCVTEVGRGCGSSAWVFTILGVHHWIGSLFGAKVQDEIYGDKDHALWPLTFAGRGGDAVPVEGGYRVTGHWGFASGVDFSDWVGVSALIQKEGAKEPDDRLHLIVPKSEVEVIDTWHVSGMRATGSRDVVAKDVFVPAHRTLTQGDILNYRSPGLAVHPDYAALKIPFYGVMVAAVMGPPLGIAKGVLDEFLAYTQSRVAFRGPNQLDRQSIHVKVGLASAKIAAAEALCRNVMREMQDTAEAGDYATPEQRMRWRRDSAYLVQLCAEAVDMIVATAGARAQHQSSPFQRAQRDILTMRSHVILDLDPALELYGRELLGLPPISLQF